MILAPKFDTATFAPQCSHAPIAIQFEQSGNRFSAFRTIEEVRALIHQMQVACDAAEHADMVSVAFSDAPVLITFDLKVAS